MSRVAVVTGAAAGIGASTCDVLEADGWDVIAVDRVPMSRPNSIELDVADAAQVRSALGGLDRVDGLVNNAAVQLFSPMTEITVEQWDRVAEVNLRGAFSCLQAVIPQLAESGGAVVNVCSVHAHSTSLGTAAYAASKGGLLALTRSAALELAGRGVRVNAVTPGAVDTEALRAGLHRSPDAEASLIARTPLGRIGQPTEIAHAISFLLDSGRSGFITGQELVADGGALARLSTE